MGTRVQSQINTVSVKKKETNKKNMVSVQTPPARDAVSLFTIKNLWHFDILRHGSRWGSGWTEVVKKTLLDFHHLPSLLVFAH